MDFVGTKGIMVFAGKKSYDVHNDSNIHNLYRDCNRKAECRLKHKNNWKYRRNFIFAYRICYNLLFMAQIAVVQ